MRRLHGGFANYGVTGLFGQTVVVALAFEELFFTQFLDIYRLVVSAFHGPDNFVELQVHGGGVVRLGVLQEKDHQKRHHGGSGIDDELPGVAPVEEGS